MHAHVPCTFENLDVDSVTLDLENPRISKWIEMYGGNITAEQMSLALGAGDSQSADGGTTFHSLRESIKTSGCIIHPIIVNKTQDQLLVIEGNTRTIIYREFREQDVPGNWDRIPAIVYCGLSRAEIDAIRLQAHLVGPRPWDPYSKAKYLNHLRNAQHLTLAQIVDYCGGRKREVQDYIAGYCDMEKYYRPLLDSDADFDPTRFSAFVELQRPRVKEAIQSSGADYSEFARWVIDGRFSRLEDIRQLYRILRSDKARTTFLENDSREAFSTLDAPTTDAALAEASLYQLAREVAKRIRYLLFEELQRLRSEAASDKNEALCDARDQLTQLCVEIAADD